MMNIKKTSMSVPEMQKMLGMGKTNSYHLLKKGYFETIIVGRNIRILVDSFEEWYQSQSHYKKVNECVGGESDGINR